MQKSSSSTSNTTPKTTNTCVDKNSLRCANEPELSYECTEEYKNWAQTNCPDWVPEDQFCGGIAGTSCPDGYECKMDGDYPDAGGVCTKSTEQIPSISESDLSQGWYWVTNNQKKINTPVDWLYEDGGRTACWHKPDVQCTFLPDQ